MSIIRVIQVLCNGCHEILEVGTGDMSVVEARRAAAAAGWLHKPNEDLCGFCRAFNEPRKEVK